MKHFLVVLALFSLCSCAHMGDYGDIFKDAVLPILVAEGAPKARAYVAKLVEEGRLTQEQADKINAIIDQLSKRRIDND